MTKHLIEKFIGYWKSDSSVIDEISFDAYSYSTTDEQGQWRITEKELWMIEKDLRDGIKWFFKFEGDNTLLLYNPEDFMYQGGGNYLYYQMTSPTTKIYFKRINQP